ncbi:MAG: ATP-binding cassette domain-containing protein [Pyrinomonadaceae bacterium]
MTLTIENLSKRIANKWIFRDIEFCVNTGEIFGICGSTGSGKTSILRAVAGIHKSNGGVIKLDGVEQTAKNSNKSAYKLIAKYPLPGFAGIFGGFFSKESSGQRQIAAFDRLLVSNFEVLLLDDPFTDLDPIERNKRLIDLRSAAIKRNLMVIFASSDFAQVSAVADKMAILVDGQFSQIGSPKEIYDHPHSIIAAKLSGEVNLFQARRLTSSDANLPEFQTIDGGHRLFSSPDKIARLGAINQNVTLSIRPENVSMSMGASFPEDNLVKAVVTGSRYYGATSLIDFDAFGIKLTSRVFKVVGLNIGDECMLSLPPNSICVLKR